MKEWPYEKKEPHKLNIVQQEVRMYGLTISTDECFRDMQSGGEKIRQICEKSEGLPAVYQDPAGQYQMLLFLTPEKREAAYKKARELGIETAAICSQPVYVDSRYLKGVE